MSEEARVRVDLPWSCAASDNLRKQYHDRAAYGRYKSARKEVRVKAHNAMIGKGGPLEGPVEVGISVAPPDEPGLGEMDPDRLDLTNLVKVICDGMEEEVYENDRQIVGLTIRRLDPDQGGGISVWIYPADREEERFT